MKQTKSETSLKQIREEIWTKNKARERETDTHPCDNWKAEKCMCKGSCTCHWVEMSPDVADIIKSLRDLNAKFYALCFHAHVGSNAHAFIEFNGLMHKYIDLVERAALNGIHPQSLNEHNGVPLPVEGHDMEYLGEKLRCIFGPVLDSNPEARKILKKALFPHDPE